MDIIAFFSFKGGVGRTALLANLAAHWAAEGRVVAMMDLDLAAPGLSYLPLLGGYLDERGSGLGMVDLLQRYFSGIEAHQESGASAPPSIHLLRPRFLLREVRPPAAHNSGRSWHPDGRLLAITAGSARLRRVGPVDEGLLRPVPRPDDADPQRATLQGLATHLRRDLEAWRVPDGPAAGRAIDYLLIDSRTGFAELLDLSLGYLADRMVLVSGLNAQNLHGLDLTLRALVEEGRVPLDLFPALVTLVLSPVPAGEDDAVAAALAAAYDTVRAVLRPTRSGYPEQPPPDFLIHYTPLLATREPLLTVERRRSLYSREVGEIANHLARRPEGDHEVRDELSREVRRRVLAAAGAVPPTPTPTRRGHALAERPHPYTDLPPWYWPLPPERQVPEARLARLTELMPENPAVTVDREWLASSLSWSVSVTTREKTTVLNEYPRLGQVQVEQLLGNLLQERGKFVAARLSDVESSRLLEVLFDRELEWGRLVLAEGDAADRRFLLAPLAGESLFPTWEAWPDYWLLLARECVRRMRDVAAALAALARAEGVVRRGEGLRVAERLLELFIPGQFPAEVVDKAETLARRVGADDRWLGFALARHALAGTPADREKAGAYLEPLLRDPPADGEQCRRLGLFVLGNLPELAVAAEAATRKAVELLPNDAVAWHGLGNLLKNHLSRYEEAEAAYRQAIELDPKYAYPWNGLGNLLQDHLSRYEEAEAAYRQAIELDPKFAHPWNGLGTLLQDHLSRYEEAEAAYRQAIELDPKYASLWNNLGTLLQYHLSRYEEAEAAYRQAIELDPKDASPWNGLGSLRKDVHADCAGAMAAFQRGLAADPDAPYPAMNLGHLYLLLGERDTAERLLRQALAGFRESKPEDPNLLLLALEVDDSEAVRTCAARVEGRLARGGDTLGWKASSLLKSWAEGDIAAAATWREATLAALASHHHCYDLLTDLHLFAAMRPDSLEPARRLAADLLDLPPTTTARFRDQPKPSAWYDRFRPFAAGRSSGAGDPRDRHLFCREAAGA